MSERGMSAGRYLFELDGITAIRASDVSGIKKIHEEFEIYESNRPNPIIGRGHFKCETITVKHAHALNGTGQEFFRWMQDFITGAKVERRSGRCIQLDEDGLTPIKTWELMECIPISIEQETNTGGSKEGNYFKFAIRPTDLVMI